VLVDVNWRSVFWANHAEAKAIITDYLKQVSSCSLSLCLSYVE